MASSTHYEALAKIVLNNLENQQDWTNLTTHSQSSSRPRPLITGLPPRRMYVHPDEQIEIIKAEKVQGERIAQSPELEWVLPIHLSEKFSLNTFAAVFDSIEAIPPGTEVDEGVDEWKKWRGSKRGKRIVLATVHEDSTVVYYMMHDGVVKPRQN